VARLAKIEKLTPASVKRLLQEGRIALRSELRDPDVLLLAGFTVAGLYSVDPGGVARFSAAK
jgi:hypothetical protein